ncbi:lipid-binding protein [Flavobacteriaceae bacterium R38]|nr:lipid-binding protein [Flavobacteriaceae bacterium R38]
MKQPLIYIFLFLITFNSYSQEWKLKKDKKGIKVYTRKLKTTKLCEFKATTLIKTTLETALNTITDGDNLWKWNYKTSESKTIAKLSENEFIVWMENDFTWPVKNRDNVSRLKVIALKDGGYRVNISAEHPNTVALIRGNIRITKFEGYWLLIPRGEYVEITQQVYGDPKGKLPYWIINNILTAAPYHSFSNLKELLEK